MIESVTPRQVQIKIEFTKIGQIDMMNEKFTCEVLIESKWYDNDCFDFTSYKADKHWNPKLYIQNVLDNPKETINYKIINSENGVLITETRTIRAEFWERLELNDFPFDMQQFHVIIKTKLKPNEISFVADTGSYSLINRDAKRSFIDQQKWKLLNIVKLSDSIQSKNAHYSMKTSTPNKTITSNDTKNLISPKIIATFYCTRQPGYYLFNAFFLIFLITALSFTVFSIPTCLPQNRLSTIYVILLSSISFKWVINRFLPPVSYLTFLDKYSIVCIFFLCVTAVWHSIIGSFSLSRDNKIINSEWTSNIDFWVMIAFFCIFVCMQLFWIKRYVHVTRWVYFLQAEEKRFIKEYLKRTNRTTLYEEDDEDEDPNKSDFITLNVIDHLIFKF